MCIKFKDPSDPFSKGQGRFSINFFGIRLSNIGTAVDLTRAGSDDEHALTTIATKEGYSECMFVPLTVSHLSFNPQREADQALPLYEELASRALSANSNVNVGKGKDKGKGVK